MKKLLFITALVFMGIVVSSCSKGDDNNSPTYSIVGVWQIESLFGVYEFKANNTWFKYGYYEDYENNNPIENGTYTFDGHYLIRDGGFKEEITFSEDGKQMLFNCKKYTKKK